MLLHSFEVIGNLSIGRSWFTNGMAGRAELEKGRGLRAKCKSLIKTTWKNHERRQNNSETWFQTKNFYFCMTNTLRRTQNLNLWFQPENSRFKVRDRSSRTSWHAQWLSCCKNTSGWRPWYQERLVLKFPNNAQQSTFDGFRPDETRNDGLSHRVINLSLPLTNVLPKTDYAYRQCNQAV